MPALSRPAPAPCDRPRLRRLGARAAAVLLAAGTLGPAAVAAPPAKPPKPAPAPATCQAGESAFFRDEGLSFKVSGRLQFNKQLMREKIHVKVNGGVATLSGGVSTAEHIALAVKLAREVEGIRCVNNFLKVGPSEPPPGSGAGPQG